MIIKRYILLLILGGTALFAKPLAYKVIDSLPHNPRSFTQGLIYHDNKLVESTGSTGRGTTVLIIDPTSGKEIRSTPVQPHFFGEGLDCDGQVLFQLSWKQGLVYLYAWPTLQPMGTIPYKGEGWGLAYDMGAFYMSNGTDIIQVFNRSFTKIIREIAVTHKDKPVSELNELEFVHDRLYANKWFSDSLFIINPLSGVVEHTVDLSELVKTISAKPEGGVLNGIAHKQDNQFYVTGKLWPWIYVIEIESLE